MVAFWVHLDMCRCLQGNLRMLFRSLKPLCVAPGVPGSIWMNFWAVVRSTGMSGSFVCGFRTNLHLADVCSLQSSSVLLWKDRLFSTLIHSLYLYQFGLFACCTGASLLWEVPFNLHPRSAVWNSSFLLQFLSLRHSLYSHFPYNSSKLCTPLFLVVGLLFLMYISHCLSHHI